MKIIEERLKFIETELENIKRDLKDDSNIYQDSIFPPISELTTKEDLEKYPNSLFCFHGDTFILELEKADNQLIGWVNYTKIWNPISIKNNWNYDQTQAFLKARIKEHFKLRDVTPKIVFDSQLIQIKEHFKLRDVTPRYCNKRESNRIEEHFKMREVTPKSK